MKKNRPTTFQQKFGLGVFIVIAGATFVFGLIRLRKDIVLPLARSKSDITIKTTEQLEQERQRELQSSDTDDDGVSDYDELYVFRTSPFLEDSDSDGILDGVEIQNQTDPNCPLGKTCGERARASTTESSSRVSVPYLAQDPTMGALAPEANRGEGGTATSTGKSEEEIMAIVTETFGDPSQLSTEQIAEKLQSMPSVELRQFLVKLGIPQDILNKTDDATIRALLQQTLDELGSEDVPTQ